MILSLVDIVYISLSAITFSLYMVLIKKTPKDRYLVSLFWVHTLAYAMYITAYLYRKFVLERDVTTIENLLHEYTYFNAPLYLLFAVSSLASIVVFRNLIKQFDISLVVPFSQISILFTYIGITLLGGQFSWLELAGIVTICAGAIFTATTHFDWHSPAKLFTKLPPALWKGAVAEALLKSGTMIIIFLLTQKTAINEKIIGSLTHVFPFAQYENFYTNIGTRLFTIVLFYWYLHHQESYRKLIIPTIKQYWPLIVSISAIYLTSTVTYQLAYFLTADKGMLAALSKLNVPLLLLFASILLKEKITPEKIIGSIVVVIGGFIVLYAQ